MKVSIVTAVRNGAYDAFDKHPAPGTGDVIGCLNAGGGGGSRATVRAEGRPIEFLGMRSREVANEPCARGTPQHGLKRLLAISEPTGKQVRAG